MSKHQQAVLKLVAACLISGALVTMLFTVSVMAINGTVDLKDSATSLFVGSLVGNISGLLQAPLVWYFGHSIVSKGKTSQNTSGAEDDDR